MDKKKVFAIALFFVMGFFMFVFANPSDETKKIKEDDKNVEETVKDENTTPDEDTVIPDTPVEVTPMAATTIAPIPALADNVITDNVIPVITLNGGDIIIRTTDVYNDLGATANDNVDGDITSKIVTASNVENTKGEYNVTYNVTDNSGNKANEVTRNVTVVDVTDLEEAILDGNSILDETDGREVSGELAELLEQLKDAMIEGAGLIENPETLQDPIDKSEEKIEEIIEKIRNLKFTVSFVDWDGSEIDTQTVKYNTSAIVPADPTRNGYIFDNWDGNYSNVMVDETVTALYNIVTYNIIYNTTGDFINQPTYTIEDNFDLAIPVKQGFTCSKWVDKDNKEYTRISNSYGDLELTSVCTPNTDTKYTVEVYYQNIDNDNYTKNNTYTLNGTTNSTIDVETLKATYLPTNFKFASIGTDSDEKIKGNGNSIVEIYYDRNDFTLSFVTTGSSVESKQYRYGKTVSLNTFNSSSNGYNFDGWYIDTDKKSEVTMNSDITLTAKFTPINYTISYDLKCGTLDKANKPSYTIEDTVEFNTPKKEGFVFKHWIEKTNIAMGYINKIEKGTTGNLELVAIYEEATNTKYTVKKYEENLNGEYIEVDSDELTATTNSTVSVDTPAIDGFSVNNVLSTTSGVVNANGSLVLNIYYSRNSYTITFDSKDGSKVNDIVAKYEAPVTLPTPTRSKYIFTGWDQEITTMPLNGANLTASWQHEDVTVKFINDDGTPVDTQTINYDSTVTQPNSSPTKDSDESYIYDFEYWYLSTDTTKSQFNFDTTITENITLVAYYSSIAKEDFIDQETPFIVVEIDNKWLDARLKTNYMDKKITYKYNSNYVYGAKEVEVYKNNNKYYLDKEFTKDTGLTKANPGKKCPNNANRCKKRDEINYYYAYVIESSKIESKLSSGITVRYSKDKDVLGTYATSEALENYNSLKQAYDYWADDYNTSYKNGTGYHYHVTENVIYNENYSNNTGDLTKYKYVYVEYTEGTTKYILVYQKSSKEYTLVRRHKISI